MGQPNGNGQVQLPTKNPAKLRRYKVAFVFEHPANPGGEAIVVASDMPSAAGIFFAQVHNIDLPIKHANFVAMEDNRIIPSATIPHLPG